MTVARRVAPWLGRFVLLADTVVFTLIGVRHLADPLGEARALHSPITSAAGATAMRVACGAFPLGIAVVLLACLWSSRRRLFGLATVATVMGLALGARLLGLALDGPAPESTRLLVPEIVMLALATFAAGLDWSARRGGADEGPGHDARSGIGATGPWRRRLGVTLLVGPATLLGASAIAKLAGAPAVVGQLGSIGFGSLVPVVGVLELASAGLLAFPLTRPLGLLMVSAFLGGAIAAHLGHGLSPLPPAIPLSLIWLGTWLRHPELASLARVSRPVAGGRPSPAAGLTGQA